MVFIDGYVYLYGGRSRIILSEIVKLDLSLIIRII